MLALILIVGVLVYIAYKTGYEKGYNKGVAATKSSFKPVTARKRHKE